jgi:hypothetical protein
MIEAGVLRDTRSKPSPCTTGPDLSVGRLAIQPGPMMAAFDIFEIEIQERGAHAANLSTRGGANFRQPTSRYSLGRACTGSKSDQSPCSTSNPSGNGGLGCMPSDRMTLSSR